MSLFTYWDDRDDAESERQLQKMFQPQIDAAYEEGRQQERAIWRAHVKAMIDRHMDGYADANGFVVSVLRTLYQQMGGT